MKTTCPAGQNITQHIHFSLHEGGGWRVPQNAIKDPGMAWMGIRFSVLLLLENTWPGHGPAWQKQFRIGAGRDFLVLIGNAEQEQEVFNMHYLTLYPRVKSYTVLVEKQKRVKLDVNNELEFLNHLKLLKRPCKHPQQPQSHSVELIFSPWFENLSGLTLVPIQS